jgi:hypothetical protein
MTKDLFIDLNYRSGPSPSSCLHVHPNNELSNSMNNEHPITPPSELIQKWIGLINYYSPFWKQQLIVNAYQAGADQELEECFRWMKDEGYKETAQLLYSARRPKSPSLKEQALGALEHLALGPDPTAFLADMDTIRRALEALPNG